jgi:hypothetical protein
LSAKIQCAIEYYIDCRDPDRAAMLAGMDPKEFRRFMKHDDVKALIDKKTDLIDKATAKIVAEARSLNVYFLDTHLVKAAKKGAERGDVRAIELGYERIGMRRDHNFMTAQQATTQTRPQIYRVIEKTTERQIVAGDAPPTIDASPLRLPRADQAEILEY